MKLRIAFISLTLLASISCYSMEHYPITILQEEDGMNEDAISAALFAAAENNELTTIKIYQEHIKQNYSTIRDEAQKDLLQTAILAGSNKVVDWLLDNIDNLDFTHKDIMQRSALHMAIEKADNMNVKKILERFPNESLDICESGGCQTLLSSALNILKRIIRDKENDGCFKVVEIIHELLKKSTEVTTAIITQALDMALAAGTRRHVFIETIKLILGKIEVLDSAQNPFVIDSYVMRIASAPRDQNDLLLLFLNSLRIVKHSRLLSQNVVEALKIADKNKNQNCCGILFNILRNNKERVQKERTRTFNIAVSDEPISEGQRRHLQDNAIPMEEEIIESGTVASFSRQQGPGHPADVSPTIRKTTSSQPRRAVPTNEVLDPQLLLAIRTNDVVSVRQYLNNDFSISLLPYVNFALDLFIMLEEGQESREGSSAIIALLIEEIKAKDNASFLLEKVVRYIMSKSYDYNSYVQKANYATLLKLMLKHINNYTSLQDIFHKIVRLKGDHSYIIKKLLKKSNVLPVIQDSKDRTPLHLALTHDNTQCAAELLKNDLVRSKRYERDYRNRSALTIAIAKNFQAIVDLLLTDDMIVPHYPLIPIPIRSNAQTAPPRMPDYFEELWGSLGLRRQV